MAFQFGEKFLPDAQAQYSILSTLLKVQHIIKHALNVVWVLTLFMSLTQG